MFVRIAAKNGIIRKTIDSGQTRTICKPPLMKNDNINFDLNTKHLSRKEMM